MTNDHKLRLQESIRENSDVFDMARDRNDWTLAHRAWLAMLHKMDVAIRSAVEARIEADALAAELLVYRPTRADRPAAPPLSGYAYVFTAKFPWVCAAIELCKTMYIPALFGGGYQQEHYSPERKTLCGKKTAFPVTERFASGGWPRLHELCPDCTAILVEKRLLGNGAGRVPLHRT